MDSNPPPAASNRPISPDRTNLLTTAAAVGVIAWLLLLADVLTMAFASPAVAAAVVALTAAAVSPVLVLLAIRLTKRRVASAAIDRVSSGSPEPEPLQVTGH